MIWTVRVQRPAPHGIGTLEEHHRLWQVGLDKRDAASLPDQGDNL